MNRSTIRIGRTGRKAAEHDTVEQPSVFKIGTVAKRIVEETKRSTMRIGTVGTPVDEPAASPTISIGVVKYSPDQPRDYHGRFGFSTDFKDWDGVTKFFDKFDVKVNTESLSALGITPEDMHVIAERALDINAKFPGALDELKYIEGTDKYGKSEDMVIAAVDNMRLYGTYGDTRTTEEGSRMWLTQNFADFIANPEHLESTLGNYPGYLTSTDVGDFITHEMGHVVQNMSESEMGSPWVQQFWSRPDGLMQQAMAEAGYMTADARYKGGFRKEESLIRDDISDYANSTPSEFHSEVLVLFKDKEKFDALPAETQERLRTYQRFINETAGKDLVKALLTDDTVERPKVGHDDDFGLPPEFWREFHEAIGKPDTVTKDAESGRRQAHGEHGRFASGGDSSTETVTMWHITSDPNFVIDPTRVPEDNTTLGMKSDPGLYVSSDPERWINGYDYVRPYIVELKVPKDLLANATGGYAGEKFLTAEDLDKVKIGRVIPLDAYARETYGGTGWIEEHHGTSFDTSEPVNWRDKFKDYVYDGPDVRDMTLDETERHRERWLEYMRDSRGFDDERIEELRQETAPVTTVTKDAASGRTQLRDEHGRFTNEAEPQLKLEENVRMVSSEVPITLRSRLNDEIERINKRQYPKGTDVAAQRKADIEEVTREHTLTTWKTPDGGQVRFAYADWDTTLQRRFVDEVVSLQKKNPDGSDDITVVGPRGFMGGYGLQLGTGVFEFTNGVTMGLTHDSGQVYVNGTITYTKTVQEWGEGIKNGFHPEEMTNVEPWRSVLVHEYGHSLDAGMADLNSLTDSSSRSPETQQALADYPSSSTYGLKDYYEAYAEAFAQYRLSGGTTTDPLAQALAKTEGWTA